MAKQGGTENPFRQGTVFKRFFGHKIPGFFKILFVGNRSKFWPKIGSSTVIKVEGNFFARTPNPVKGQVGGVLRSLLEHRKRTQPHNLLISERGHHYEFRKGFCSLMGSYLLDKDGPLRLCPAHAALAVDQPFDKRTNQMIRRMPHTRSQLSSHPRSDLAHSLMCGGCSDIRSASIRL